MRLFKKKTLSYILVASMAMAALTGCSKEDKKEDAVVEDNATVTEGVEENTEEVTEGADEATEETTEESTEETEEVTEETEEAGNVMTAYQQGFGGEITVNVTLNEDGSIAAIDVDASTETPELGGAAAPVVAAAIVEAQSVDVDAVAGATVTSTAVKEAVNAILTVAGSDLAQ